MPSITEAGNQGQLYAALRDGIDILDKMSEFNFVVYTRVVLPLDDYIFWQPLKTQCFKGSLHYTQDIAQNTDETYGAATVLFTSKDKIVEFEGAPTNTIFVGSVGGFRFAFSQQQGFYGPAELWHYFGRSIPPAMESLLLDRQGQIDPKQAIVNNSIPLWLGLNNYPALYPDFFSNDIPLYPADLVSPNMEPPYGVVDVQDTRTLQSAPYIDPRTRSHWQLAVDRVQVTLYGLQANAALDFQDCVNQYSKFTGNFGVMNMPVVSDSPRRKEASLEAIAQKKTILYEISYQQQRVQEIALQLIKSVDITFYFPGQAPSTININPS